MIITLKLRLIMIDYEKLKLAHELAEKAGSYISYAYENKSGNFVNRVDLDQLILELKELTKTKPKYEVGQEVFALHRDQIIPFTIEKIDSQGTEYWYCFRENEYQVNRFIETILYPTRQALIDAQIEYWQRLADSDDLGRCEYHQTDGIFYIKTERGYIREEPDPMSYPDERLTKCKHCGEFYR